MHECVCDCRKAGGATAAALCAAGKRAGALLWRGSSASTGTRTTCTRRRKDVIQVRPQPLSPPTPDSILPLPPRFHAFSHRPLFVAQIRRRKPPPCTGPPSRRSWTAGRCRPATPSSTSPGTTTTTPPNSHRYCKQIKRGLKYFPKKKYTTAVFLLIFFFVA
jgi:hypothetical protein